MNYGAKLMTSRPTPLMAGLGLIPKMTLGCFLIGLCSRMSLTPLTIGYTWLKTQPEYADAEDC
jgi:hypothetical protein